MHSGVRFSFIVLLCVAQSNGRSGNELLLQDRTEGSTSATGLDGKAELAAGLAHAGGGFRAMGASLGFTKVRHACGMRVLYLRIAASLQVAVKCKE